MKVILFRKRHSKTTQCDHFCYICGKKTIHGGASPLADQQCQNKFCTRCGECVTHTPSILPPYYNNTLKDHMVGCCPCGCLFTYTRRDCMYPAFPDMVTPYDVQAEFAARETEDKGYVTCPLCEKMLVRISYSAYVNANTLEGLLQMAQNSRNFIENRNENK